MSNNIHNVDNNHEHHHDHDMHVRDTSNYGFWLYLMTDCALFGTLFVIFIILGMGTIPYKFDLSLVIAETFILLTSSFTFGLAVLFMYKNNIKQVFTWLAITFILGASFIFLEIKEFAHLIEEGKNWTTHAYYSAFFTLVGTHGLHVSVGLLWMILLAIQIKIHGINATTTTKLLMLSLFWHFLDIVWIFVFSFVYLVGAL